MPISTEDQHLVTRLEQAIEFKTRRVKRLHRIKQIAEIDAWPALKEELEHSAKTNEDLNLMDLERPADDACNPTAQLLNLKNRAAASRAYRGIIFIVEQADDRARVLNEEIAEHRRKMREMENKSGVKETSTIHPRRNIA